MALSDLAVFSEYTYTTLTEVLTQQVDLFNAASRGAITLQTEKHVGDYSDIASFGKIQGLVRRRNPYATGAVAPKTLRHIVDTMVKVAAGTPPVDISPAQFKWIQQNPEVAGAVIGKQLAIDALADMLNTGIMAAVAALSNNSNVVYDGSVLTSPNDGMNPSQMNSAAALFGDQSAALTAWVMHSAAAHAFYGNNLANANRLFSYGTVNVTTDPFGRVFVVTDCPALVTPATTGGSPTPAIYKTLGLVPGAIECDQNDDYTDNTETRNGDENIMRTYQAEWSYSLGIKGYSWDKSNGGHAPNDSALAVGTNWDKYVTSDKETAGVLLKTH